jgi:hypothetical protein
MAVHAKVVNGSSETVAGLLSALVVTSLFGVPIAYALMLLFGVPAAVAVLKFRS